MKKYQQLLLCLLLLSAIITKDEHNKTTSDSKNYNNKINLNTKQNSTSKDFKESNLNKTDFNLTIDEKDKLMFCSYFVEQSLNYNKGPIRGLANKTNVSYGMVFEKVGSDIFEHCYNKMPMKIVNKYLKNLTYLGGFKLTKEYADYVTIHYDKYKNKNDFELSKNQELLNDKYKNAKEFFIIVQMEKRKKMIDELNKPKNKEEIKKNVENKIKFRKYPINTIIFLMIFAILIITAVFLLGSLINKKKNIKKDKKAKTQ